MAAFFVTTGGSQRPVAQIKMIGARAQNATPHGMPVFQVTMADGETVSVHDYEINRITQSPVHLIPAAPATFLLGIVEAADENSSAVWQIPVICWAINDEGAVTPYTPDGPNDGLSQARPILMPNGIVIDQGDQSWRSIEKWFEFEKAEAKRIADAEAQVASDPEPERPTDGSPPEAFERHAAWVERNPI